jgi:NADPH:quinone reductase-like Zn-dependent oxidoreductase
MRRNDEQRLGEFRGCRMRTVRFDEYGDYDVLKVVEVPGAGVGPGEVLVQMRAAAVNPFDDSVQRGRIAEVKPPAAPGTGGWGWSSRAMDSRSARA